MTGRLFRINTACRPDAAAATVRPRWEAFVRGWCRYRTALLVALVALQCVAAPLRMAIDVPRLVADRDRASAWDLKLRYREVRHWFAGQPVYRELHGASYPPASYLFLWPLLGWLPLTAARWLWAATLACALGAFIRLLLRESGAQTRLERAFIALMVLSMNGTSLTIAMGQLTIHLLPPLLVGLLVLARGRGGWREDVLAALCVLVTWVKPTISLPFCWLVLFFPGRLRPSVLAALGYAALTAFAAAFQKEGLPALLHDWRMRASMVSLYAGHTSLRRVLVVAGLGEWAAPAALLVLLALGAWLYRYRRADIWLLIGITAMIARLWTYHRIYDDVLILFPMVALFQIAKREIAAGKSNVLAEVLLGATALAALCPARWLVDPSWAHEWEGLIAVLWVTVLLFLIGCVHRGARSALPVAA